jgi:TPR repeat protein
VKAGLFRRILPALVLAGFASFGLVAKPARKSLDDFRANVRDSLRQWSALPEQQTNVLREVSGMTPVSPADFAREARRMAGVGDKRGEALLGLMLYFGYGLEVDKPEAARWLRRAADHGVAAAQVCLGRMLAAGETGRTNQAEAIRLFQLAADQNFAAGQFQLAMVHHLGLGSATNLAEARRLYELADAQNFAPATCHLGTFYDRGLGVGRDLGKAFELYRKSASQSYPMAIFNVGVSFALGEGTRQDFTAAATWYRRAAVLGYFPAMHNLGNALMNGRGVARDPVEAARWFRESAAAGVTESRAGLALLILDKAVPGEVSEAIEGLRESAAQGNLLSAGLLGGIYAGLQPGLSHEVPVDYAAALRFLEPAARAGHVVAEQGLGHLYHFGQGVPRDGAEAYKWLTLSARSGYDAARAELRELNRGISPQEMADGERRVRSFRPEAVPNPDGETFMPQPR